MEDHAHDISQMMIDHEQDILNQIEELQNDLVHIREKVRYYAAVEDAIKKSEPIPEWHQFFCQREECDQKQCRQKLVSLYY